MKTLELDLKKKVLIIQPEETGNMHSWIKIYSDNWDFKCLGSELTEEITSELVDYWQNMANDGFIFENYKDNLPKKLTANDALISAVESKGFYWLENPIKIIERGEDTEHNRVFNQNKWREAEEKTFKNPLIFVKK